MLFDPEDEKTWPKTEGPWLVEDKDGNLARLMRVAGQSGYRFWKHAVRYVAMPDLAAEDPHGWVSVEKAMPEAGQRVEVWTDRGGQMFRLWSSALIGLVTHWRLPTPGPQTEGGGS